MSIKGAYSRKIWLYRLGAVFLIAVVWEIMGMRSNPVIFPAFSSVMKAWYRIVVSGEVLKAVLGTLSTTFIGFVFSLAVSVPVGLLMGRYRKIENFMMPYITIAMVVPMIALIPLLVMWFGLGVTTRIAVVFLFSAVVMVVNVAGGVKNTDVSLAEMARSYGASERVLFIKIRMPSALPLIMAGFRLGVGRAIMGALTSEMIITLLGMGNLLLFHMASYDTDVVFAAILTVMVLSVSLLQTVQYIDRKVVFWHN